MTELRDCVIFDLDGTLSDPQVGIARSINYALAHHGFDTVERYADVGYSENVLYPGIRDALATLSAAGSRWACARASESTSQSGS